MIDHVDVAAGVIDSDHTGPVKVLLVNCSQKRFNIAKGDPIAHIIFELAATPAVRLLSFFEKSPTRTQRIQQ